MYNSSSEAHIYDYNMPLFTNNLNYVVIPNESSTKPNYNSF